MSPSPSSIVDENISNRLENIEIALTQYQSKCASIQNVDSDMIEARLELLENNLTLINSKENTHLDDIVTLSTKIESLEAEIARLNQYGRKENIILSGIPDNVGHSHLEQVVVTTPIHSSLSSEVVSHHEFHLAQ